MLKLAFGVLGPLEVLADGHPVGINAARQRIVLAVLLMAPNHVVPVDRLIDSVWDGEPPTTARGQIQICISALRRTLGSSGLIDTSPSGYMIRVDPDQLDYAVFDRTMANARAAANEGRLHEALQHLDAALSIWRGLALADVPGRAAAALSNRLEERHIMALEFRAEIRLGLGEHRELVDELFMLAAEYPLRERIWGFLMLALYRSSRQAEALEVFRSARQTLVDEFGLEPGKDLLHMQRAILDHDSSLDLAVTGAQPSVWPPRELPADIADYVGHDELVAGLVRLLTSVGARPDKPDKKEDSPGRDGLSEPDIPVVVITGPPGCGKTTLAVHIAHLVREYFPDGQLFVRMHGDSAQPASTMAVLARLLRALGVTPEAVPADRDERVNLLRSLVAHRRLLALFDEVADENQVTDLLPGVPGPAVLITSRTRLVAMHRVRVAEMSPMREADAVRLLGLIAGGGRIPAEDAAATVVARICDGLPLAIRIAGVRLAAHPHWSVSTLVDLLVDERRRLDELSHGDLGIRPVLAVVHDALAPRTRELFHLLSTLELYQFDIPVAAALLDCEPPAAGCLLDELADARLLDAYPGEDGRWPSYRMQNLVRVFAAECMGTTDNADDRARAAAERVFGYLLAMMNEAHGRLYGGDYTLLRGNAYRWHGARSPYFQRLLVEPMDWLDAQRPILRATIFQAARLGMDELCWELALNAVTLYEARGMFDEWRDTNAAALDVVRAAGNRRGEAALLASRGSLGIAQHSRNDVETLLTALTLFSEVHDATGEAIALRNLGQIDRIQGRPSNAVARYEQALTRFREVADEGGQAHVLSGLARAYLDLGDNSKAEVLAKEALALSQRLGNTRLQAQSLFRLGEVLVEAAQTIAARGVFQEALKLARPQGDRVGQAYALHGLGLAALECGDLEGAEVHFMEAIEICQTVNERNVQAQVTFGLGRIHDARGEYERAEHYYVQAANAFAAQENEPWHERAIEALRAVRKAAGHLPIPRHLDYPDYRWPC